MCGFRIEVDGLEVGDKSWDHDSIDPASETTILHITYPPHVARQARGRELTPKLSVDPQHSH